MRLSNTVRSHPLAAHRRRARLPEIARPTSATGREREPMSDRVAKPTAAPAVRITVTCVVGLLSVALIGAAHVVPTPRKSVRPRTTRALPVKQVERTKVAPPTQPKELLQDVAAPVATGASSSAARRVAAVAPLRKVRTIRMQVTAYCPCTKCCGPDAHGVTASGRPVSHNGGRFVAADTRLLSFGTKLVIPGYHAERPVEVIDRGGAIKGHKLDVYFPTHQEALEWGRQWLTVTVVE